MTLESMQEHERVTLRHGQHDYRRSSLEELVFPQVHGPDVLDVRCLTGRLAVRLARAGRNVVALDAYEGAVAMTNELAAASGVAGPLARVWNLQGLANAVNQRSFDTVICLDVLNHVEDDRVTMSEIARALKWNGRLIVVAPAHPWLLGARDRSLGHLRRYSRAQLVQLLAGHGFVIERIRPWNALALPAYVLVERVLRRKVSDRLRYGRGDSGTPANRLLRWWYCRVENRLWFPVGMSWFVVARRYYP